MNKNGFEMREGGRKGWGFTAHTLS